MVSASAGRRTASQRQAPSQRRSRRARPPPATQRRETNRRQRAGAGRSSGRQQRLRRPTRPGPARATATAGPRASPDGDLVAAVRIDLHRPQDDRLEPFGDRRIQRPRRDELALQQPHDHGAAVVARERTPAGGHLVEHAAEREEVGARVDLDAGGLLRRHVGRRADRRTGHRDVRVGGRLHRGLRAAASRRSRLTIGQLGQAEVEHLEVIVVRDEQVGRLDVAVDDAARRARPRAPSQSGRRSRPPARPAAGLPRSAASSSGPRAAP